MVPSTWLKGEFTPDENDFSLADKKN